MKPEELEVRAAAELAKQQAFDVRLFTCSSRAVNRLTPWV